MNPTLKTISKEGIPEALSKAERYRLLNEPGEAESICRDVMAVEPDHQGALRLLGLALTDQFTGGAADRHVEAETVLRGCAIPAKALLRGNRARAPGHASDRRRAAPHRHRPFEEAMTCFKSRADPPQRQRRRDPALEPLRATPPAARLRLAPGAQFRRDRQPAGLGIG